MLPSTCIHVCMDTYIHVMHVCTGYVNVCECIRTMRFLAFFGGVLLNKWIPSYQSRNCSQPLPRIQPKTPTRISARMISSELHPLGWVHFKEMRESEGGIGPRFLEYFPLRVKEEH